MAGYHITQDELGPLVAIFAVLMMVYMVLCYLARILMRFTINGPMGADDWIIAAGSIFGILQSSLKTSEAYHGLGKRTEVVNQQNIQSIEKLAFAGDIFYLIGMMLSRVGTFFLIARLTRHTKHIRVAHLGAIISAVIGVASLFIVSIRCDVSKPWVLVPQCSAMFTRWYIAESLGIAAELFAAWVPVYLVWSLQMQLKSKLIVLFAFSFRLPVIIVAGFRLYFLHQQASHNDPLFHGARSAVCMEILLHYGLMASTIPCLKPFVKSFNTGYFDTRAVVDGSSQGEAYVLSNMSRSKYTATAENAADVPKSGSNIGGMLKGNKKGHIRSQGSDSPSSTGSDKMIIRRTTAWDVSYDNRADGEGV